jgi:anti-sigma factor RsiW
MSRDDERDDQRDFSAALKKLDLRYSAPPDLAAGIRAALAEAAEPSAALRPAPWWTRALGTDLRGGALRLTTGLGAGFALGLAVALLPALHPAAPGEATRELVSAHVRSLMVAHLEDVVSTDQHTVKPWFSGKLDFAPPVRELAAQGFPLAGGRLDYLNERAVAALVYRHDKHVINLFLWPAPGPDTPPAALPAERGYQVIAWRSAGLDYRAVSDASPETLARFAEKYRAEP